MLKITLITIGAKMPSWVEQGAREYAKRLKETAQLKIIEIPLTKRGKSSNLNRILEKEADEIISNLPSQARIIALDIEGKTFSSPELAIKINQLQLETSHLCFIIGGPEGLMDKVLELSHEKWSLSKLTLPHPLVRVILLEALYRAWSINAGHPYHK